MKITIKARVEKSIEQVWHAWTSPDWIVKWNFASEDWCCPRAELELEAGKTFNYRMEAVDGSMGFDFEGTFTQILKHQLIEFTLGDERVVSIEFKDEGGAVEIIETFEAEDIHTGEQQREGWQAILDRFKTVVESA